MASTSHGCLKLRGQNGQKGTMDQIQSVDAEWHTWATAPPDSRRWTLAGRPRLGRVGPSCVAGTPRALPPRGVAQRPRSALRRRRPPRTRASRSEAESLASRKPTTFNVPTTYQQLEPRTMQKMRAVRKAKGSRKSKGGVSSDVRPGPRAPRCPAPPSAGPDGGVVV